MFLCIASALHQPGPKGKVYLVTVQKQKLISQCLICLIVTQIQHTMRGQSNFPLSKLCCCYIFIVLKYWWQNSISAHIYVSLRLCVQMLVLESWEYLWFYWTFRIVILDYGLKLHKLSNHTLVMLQKWLEIH